MKCLRSYEWVKLLRAHLPDGKGIMSSWAKLASRAAFRKGQASYCQYNNDVSPGMWSGGIVGLKSILGVKSRNIALEIMEKLTSLGYIEYTLNPKTKKLDYKITDWVIKCSGGECMNGAVYTTEGYGFLCLPRDITERLIDNHELRTLRRTAHSYFDRLHTSGLMTKQEAYQWLAHLISAPLSQAHIGFLGEYYCKQVIEESRKMLERYRPPKVANRVRGGVA